MLTYYNLKHGELI